MSGFPESAELYFSCMSGKEAHEDIKRGIMNSKDIFSYIQKNLLLGVNIWHSTWQALIYKVYGKHYPANIGKDYWRFYADMGACYA